MLVGLEERERIAALERDGESLRDAYRLNAAMVGGDPLAREQRAYEARIGVDVHGLFRAGEAAPATGRDADGLTPQERAHLEGILAVMFRSAEAMPPSARAAGGDA